jgi:hypothetical protein
MASIHSDGNPEDFAAIVRRRRRSAPQESANCIFRVLNKNNIQPDAISLSQPNVSPIATLMFSNPGASDNSVTFEKEECQVGWTPPLQPNSCQTFCAESSLLAQSSSRTLNAIQKPIAR